MKKYTVLKVINDQETLISYLHPAHGNKNIGWQINSNHIKMELTASQIIEIEDKLIELREDLKKLHKNLDNFWGIETDTENDD